MKRIKPTREMCLQIAEACSKVVVRTGQSGLTNGNNEYILIVLPYKARFSKGWPYMTEQESSATTTTYRVNAIRMLNFLYERGHSTYNARMLVQALGKFKHAERTVDDLFDI